jgi:predicted O-linked N-acetylglucosamine transferase (SPINDLY family)
LSAPPDPLAATLEQAAALHRQGRLDEAEVAYREALRRDPRQPGVLYALAEVLADAQQTDAALAALGEALRWAPQHPQIHHRLGILLAETKRYGEAIDAFRRAIALKPDYARAWNNLGNALRANGRLTEAVDALNTALRLQPDYALGHFNLAIALREQGRHTQAEMALRQTLRLQPNDLESLSALGGVLRQLDRLGEAARIYRQLVALDPGRIDACIKLWTTEQAMCDWTHYDELLRMLRAQLESSEALAVGPFTYLYLPSTPAEQLRAAQRWVAERIGAKVAPRPALVRGAGERLRVGYLSSDLRLHAMAFLLTELLEMHDRSRFEIFAYSYGPDDGSAQRQRIKNAVDHWRDIETDSDTQAAQRIRDDGIHVLFDLNGYTKFARSAIPASRPAPVQISWLGYLGTLGAPWYDYIVTDRFVSAPESQAQFSERFLYLPHCYCPSDTRRDTDRRTPTRAECGLPESGFVFACFNNTHKILPEVFDIWMRVLREISGSVLWLVSSDPATVDNLRREAVRRNVAPERVVFAIHAPVDRYLARLRCADLILDTLPHNAGTTANDALLAGVPLLSCAGETFASRIAGSQLLAIGLDELVVHSLADYEAMALRLAREPELLAGLRARLAANRRTHPLFDMRRFTGDFETAIARAYEQATQLAPAQSEAA